MKTTDTLNLVVGLAIGIGWLIWATLFLMTLLPSGLRLLQRLELRLKPGAKTIATIAGISRSTRVVLILFWGLFAAAGFASAFERSRSFSSLLVVLSGILCLWMGIGGRKLKSKHKPDA